MTEISLIVTLNNQVTSPHVNISSKGIEVFNCDKFNILFGKAMMIEKNSIHIHLGSFAAKISKQPLKEEIN